MKLELKRIEATLKQLAAQNAANGERLSSWEANHTKEQKLRLPAQEPDRLPPKKEISTPAIAPNVASLSVTQEDRKAPMLPKLKQPTFSSHRHGVNPALPMSLLKEIETTLTRWQLELQTLLRQIQDLYLEGPIIEGWLESVTEENAQAQGTTSSVRNLSSFLPQYRLCGLDANGRPWSRPCPPQQLPSISLAIARYQKLRQMLHRKQELESRLSELAEMLVMVQGHLQKLEDQSN